MLPFPLFFVALCALKCVTAFQSSASFALARRSPTVRYTSRLFSSIAIDQLSEECMGAVMEAHKFGHELGQESLTNELLLVGLMLRPERAESTLTKYGFAPANVRAAVERTIRPNVSSDSKEPLPFSESTNQLFGQAYSIADHLGSRSSVRSEHVILALFGYNYGKLIDEAPILTVLQKMQGIQTGFRCGAFCEDLVKSLSDQPNFDMSETNNAQTVVVGGSSSGAVSGVLGQVGVDLTTLALQGKLDPVYGRNNEIRQALRTLGRRRKNNPCLTGEPGVGKTAIAEGIAQVLANAIIEQQIAKGIEVPRIQNPFRNRRKERESEKKQEEALAAKELLAQEFGYELPVCPKDLAGASLISIDLASLVAGTSNRGDFEKRVQNLIREASSNNVILFIDEIHNILGTGGDGAMNAANLLKPALARGEIRVMGATTIPEYRRYIEKDGALERRFQPLLVKEPTVDDTVRILASIVGKYEDYHDIEYTDNALSAAAKLSDRYISDRFLPDKAIDMIDEAGSMIKMQEDEENYYVTEDSIAEVVAEVTGIPVGRLDTGEKARLRNLEEALGKRIKGQNAAVKLVAKAIRRARSGMRDGKRPVASFLFAGSTGVGKTELCKALAETYYGQEKDLIRIDMSEYMDRFSTSRLVGAPPGYVGYDEGGQLTEAVRRSPHSVVLFDELEKIMDDGQLTDGKGRRVSFKNTIFVMTTNIGSADILSLVRQAAPGQSVASVVQNELDKALKPELLNRIDNVVVFSPLEYENLRSITENLVAGSIARAYNDSSIVLDVSGSVIEAITQETLPAAKEFGARPLRRAVQRYVEDTMAEAIMAEFVNESDQVQLLLQQAPKNGKQAIIKVANAGNTMSIPVDPQNGVGTASTSTESAAYGDIPDLDDFEDEEDDDEDLPREPETFQ